MNCPEIHNRLLAVASYDELPPKLQRHVETCELCARFLDRAKLLNAELAALAVPSSEDRKQAFLAELAADGPIIKTIPRTYANSNREWGVLLKPLLGLAAAVAVGVGIWALVPSPSQPIVQHEPFRHELLQRVVKLNRELAAAANPHEQLNTMTKLATELRLETTQLAKVADEHELRSLATMYERVVAQGVVAKAKQLTHFNSTAVERHEVLTAARTELSQTAMAATGLMTTASPQTRQSLQRIVTTAQEGLHQLSLEI
jgi:hypothetical protein